MIEVLLIVLVVLALVAMGIGVAVLMRVRAKSDDATAANTLHALAALENDLARLRETVQHAEQSAKADAATQRQELSAQLAGQRTELADAINKSHAAADLLRQQLAQRLDVVAKSQADAAGGLRDELNRRLDAAATAQQAMSTSVLNTLNEQLTSTRAEITKAVAALSKENATNLSGIAERVSGQLSNQGRDANESMEKLRTAVELKLTSIQSAADQKLEQMRATVDEKLSATLNTRLGESFKLVSDRLEAVQLGLGEMKSLAGNVTDLRRVMTNVKARGVWGEVQLANLLEQIFTQEQYETNYRPRPRSGEAVEFALKLPGTDAGAAVYLPIDSKFPIEDYQRLAEAADVGDVEGVRLATKALENRIYSCAKDIHDKYICVPATTNFAVLFLPTEALYAEVIKMPGLMESLVRDFKIVVQGPTTFAAFAMALLMGFRTLAIQKRSADIAKLLGAVKTDFGKFAELLGKVEEKLDDAKTNIGKARQRSTQIVRKLDKVEQLPQEQATLLLPDPNGDPDAIIDPS